ncbi:substrate-binding domain-containing protein [Rhodoferax sp.]|jgi:LacI family transcriptional regulator|uniref:substrate-binding domain-containing protein n=1 Tax=Rhodoferax sp. TaxID=50421 RepID=UPI0037841C64
MVGVVVGALHNRFMTELLEHMHDALQTAGYQLALIIEPMNNAAALHTLRPLVDGYLDGLVVMTATLDSPVVAELRQRALPMVLVVRSVDGLDVDTVEIDNVHAGAEASRHLLALGHQSIGLVLGPRNTSTSRDRHAGVEACVEQQGLKGVDVHVAWGEYTSESGYAATMRLLSSHSSMTALIAGNDTIALGILEAAMRRGLSVPEQLSVIGFDDSPMAASPLLSLTTIRQPIEAMARTAVKRLVARMTRAYLGPAVHDLLPITLIQRATTCTCSPSRSTPSC